MIIVIGVGLAGVVFARRLNAAFLLTVSEGWPFIVLLLLYITWQVLCNFLGIEPLESNYFTIKYLLSTVTGFVIGTLYFSDQNCRKMFTRIFLFCIIVAGAIAIFEMLTKSMFWSSVGVLQFSTDERTVSKFMTARLRGDGFRAASVFSHPIILGQFGAAFAPFCALRANGTRGGARIVAIVATALCLFCIYASSTRSSYFELAGAFVVASFLSSSVKRRGNAATISVKKMGAIAVFILVGILSVGSLIQMVSGRTQEERMSSEIRSSMVEKAIFTTNEQPVFGFGAGQADKLAGYIIDGGYVLDNLYLAVSVDTGWVGLFIFGALLISVGWLGWRALNSLLGESEQVTIIGFMAAFFACVIGGFITEVTDNFIFVFLAVGYFVAVIAQSKALARALAP
jgi:O-antigen ligase